MISFYKGSSSLISKYFILGKYVIAGLLLFLMPLQSWAEDTSDPDSLVQVNCQLKDKISDKPIVYAHVINRSLNIAVVTDTLGFFSIVMRRNDTLLITSIGYVEISFYLPKFWPSNYYKGLIRVGEKTYPIREVSVTSFGNYEQFKQKVVHYNPPKPPIERVTEELQMISRQEAVEWDRVRVGFNFSMKSKEEKSLENLKLILAEQEKQKIIKSKFNKQNVGELTGLEGKELNAFMNYCYLPEDFVLNAPEYDVLELVKNLYIQYRGHKKLWNNNPEKQ